MREIEIIRNKGVDLDIWTIHEQEKIDKYLIEFKRLTNTEPIYEGDGVCRYCGEKAKRMYERNTICGKHYAQLSRKGAIVPYTRYTPNEIIFEVDHAKIRTRDNKGDVTYEFIVSLESVPKILDYKWTPNRKGNGSVYCENVKHKVRLHRYVKGVDSKDLEVDHIDGDPFNNRLDNLRAVTHAQNNINKKMTPRNKSGVIGVYFIQGYGKWSASLSFEGKYHNLGYYVSKADAILARLKGERDICGSNFAPQAHLFKVWDIDTNKQIK